MTATHASPRHAALGTVFVVAQHLDRLGDVVLAPLGLTTKQWLLLAVVERGFGRRHPTLSEAAAAYGSSRQNVKAIAHGLEAGGYLRIVRDAADRRALRLVPTEKVAVFTTPEWAAREAAFLSFAFGDLQPDEVARLADLLQRWLAGIATWPDELAPAAPTGPADGPDRPAPTSVTERSIP